MRDVVQNHLLQVLSMVAMEPPIGRGTDVINDRKRDVFMAMPEADPAHYVRGQYRAISTWGVAPGSQTETFSAMRLEIDNWRWSGVPFFIRAGKSMPVTVTEVRIVFQRPPRLGFAAHHVRHPDAERARAPDRPAAGSPPETAGEEGRCAGAPSDSISTWASPTRGARGPPPMRSCSTQRCGVIVATSPARTPSRRPGGSCSRCSTRRLPVEVYEPGSWGPEASNRLVAHLGGWRDPWLPA